MDMKEERDEALAELEKVRNELAAMKKEQWLASLRVRSSQAGQEENGGQGGDSARAIWPMIPPYNIPFMTPVARKALELALKEETAKYEDNFRDLAKIVGMERELRELVAAGEAAIRQLSITVKMLTPLEEDMIRNAEKDRKERDRVAGAKEPVGIVEDGPVMFVKLYHNKDFCLWQKGVEWSLEDLAENGMTVRDGKLVVAREGEKTVGFDVTCPTRWVPTALEREKGIVEAFVRSEGVVPPDEILAAYEAKKAKKAKKAKDAESVDPDPEAVGEPS